MGGNWIGNNSFTAEMSADTGLEVVAVQAIGELMKLKAMASSGSIRNADPVSL